MKRYIREYVVGISSSEVVPFCLSQDCLGSKH
ncbi:hypothetical protein BCD96_003177 [Clostridium beijerinckii]|nr:hypothetical protein [Clostridium beijerinckii]NRU38437.1 hypothetical protein [Clostridium beijerinckii]NSA98284.1 hypothetical protein [Clostridium beijerinckii]